MRSVTPRGRQRRTWPQRLILSLNVFLVVVALTTAALLGYAYEKVGSYPRVVLDGVLAPVESRRHEPVNVLLVGVDRSEGLDPDDPIHIGRNPSSEQADVIMVLRLDPSRSEAALLSIPRDLWVPIAGTGQSSKINRAYSIGGAATLIATIDEHLGIPINHFVAVDFAGFQQVVAAIGGVEVHFPHPARDTRSGLHVPEAGCILLDPSQALAYARARSYETFEDGAWRFDHSYDFGRIQRQQDFLRRALSRAVERGARNPVTLNALLGAVEDALLLDDQLSVGQIIEIASAFRLFSPESLAAYTMADLVDRQFVAGNDALVLREAEADPLLDIFRGAGTLEPSPAAVRLSVLNGSGVANQAWEVAEDLRTLGFTVRSTDNLRGVEVERTEVRYAPGQRASAELLARYLAVPPLLVEDPSLVIVPIQLVTGSDHRGLLAEPRPPEATTPRPTPTPPPLPEEPPPTPQERAPGTPAEPDAAPAC